MLQQIIGFQWLLFSRSVVSDANSISQRKIWRHQSFIIVFASTIAGWAFFFAGILAIYVTSGILLIFRPTDFLKFPQTEIRQLEPGLPLESLEAKLRLKKLKLESESNTMIMFNLGQYNKNTGETFINQLHERYPTCKVSAYKLYA